MSIHLRSASALLLFAVVTCVAAPIPVQVCVSINGFFYPTIFVPQYYTYQNIQPKVKIVGYVESPATTARGVTLALAQNGSDCYAYIGPHVSSIAVAVNSVINSLWVAYSAAAMELSDRVNYPLFSRVIPRVDVVQPAIVSLMKYFKWTNINILCTDNSYGQAAANAVSTLLSAVGGQASATCINQFASYSAAEAVVAKALKSSSRVLFIAAASGEAAQKYGVQAVRTLDPTHSLIVVFSESLCVVNDPLWKTVSGSFCANYVANSAYDDFYSAFLNRDTTEEQRIVGAIPGLKYSRAVADNTYGGLNVLAADATRLVYAALDKYVGIHGYLPPTTLEAIAWTRNQTLDDGFMGPIAIPNGDRLLPTSMRILNAGENNVTTFVANFSTNGNFSMTQPTVYVLGRQMLLTDVPPAVDVPPPTPAAQPYWIVAVVVPSVLLLSAAVALYARHLQLLAVRPLDPSAPFVVMFIGVKNVDEVRDAGDANATAAFAHVANGVRAAVRSSGCYEARRVDESTVMVVAKTVDKALLCAAALISSMDGANWGKVMCHANEVAAVAQRVTTMETRSQTTAKSRKSLTRKSSRAVTHKHSSTQNSTSLVSLGSHPRLHIGIHYGFGMIDHDESLNTVSYVGAAVTRAAEVADAAVAGQVLVSREAHEVAEAGLASDGVSWASAGMFECLAAWDAVAPDTAIFVVKGVSDDAVLEMRAAAKRAIDAHQAGGVAGEGAAGTIASALQRADAGMSQRRIGVLCVHLPSLRDHATDASKLAATAALVDEVASIAAVHRGEVSAMVNGSIYVTVNASAAASQPVARAAIIAVEVMQYVAAQQLAGTAGVAGGTAVVGRASQGTAFAAFGLAVDLAERAQREAAKHGLKVCAIDTSSYHDLVALMHVVTIDVVATNSHDGISRVLAIIGERDTTNGEWLYSMGSSNAAGDANEHVWQRFLQLEAPEDETLALISSEQVSGLSQEIHKSLRVSVDNLRRHLPLLSAAFATRRSGVDASGAESLTLGQSLAQQLWRAAAPAM